MDRALCGLLESAWPSQGFHVFLLRALPVSGSAELFVGRSLPGTELCPSHRAGVEEQRRTAEHSVLHDGRKYWRQRPAVNGESRTLARRLRREHDGRRRERNLLLP